MYIPLVWRNGTQSGLWASQWVWECVWCLKMRSSGSRAIINNTVLCFGRGWFREWWRNTTCYVLSWSMWWIDHVDIVHLIKKWPQFKMGRWKALDSSKFSSDIVTTSLMVLPWHLQSKGYTSNANWDNLGPKWRLCFRLFSKSQSNPFSNFFLSSQQ